MSGSRAMGAMDKPGKIPEFNVFSDIEAAKKVYDAKWQDFLLTPLDHCGALVMQGQDYQKVLNSSNPVARELIHTYLVWLKTIGSDNLEPVSSSILFDTAAVRLAMPGGEDNCIIEPLSIRIADDGSWIETDERGNKRIYSFSKGLVGFYYKDTNRTVTVGGKIIACCDCATALLFS